jgi:hypothetical protein
VTPAPFIVFSAAGGAPTHLGNYFGTIGTLYFTDSQVLPATMTTNFNGCIYNVATWAPTNLTCNGAVTFASPEPQISVTNNVLFSLPSDYKYRPTMNLNRLTAGGSVRMDNALLVLTNTPLLSCGQNLTLTNLSTLTVWAGPTNVLGPDYGALVQVGGELRTATNCWIYPQSDPTNGWSALFRTRNLTLTPNSGINADGRGYKYYGTPGAGGQRGGGGYGGVGGNGYGGGGGTYGSSNAPINPGGSGGSDSYTNPDFRQAGGGLIRIEADRTVQIDGVLTADGQYTAGDRGGGAGGGIHITCKTFAGSGVIRARGANAGTTSNSGGGGGGRIAVYRMYHQWTGDLSWPSSVTNGLYGGTAAQPGTLVWGQIKAAGTVMVIR